MANPDPGAFAGVQALVLHGLPHRCVLHLLVRCPQGKSATGFLGDVLNSDLARCMSLGAGARHGDLLDPAVPLLAIGLTFHGMQRLHVPEPVLAPLRWRAPAFVAGAAARAATHLGDAGESAAGFWTHDWKIPDLDMVLSVHGLDDAALDAAQRQLRRLAAPRRVRLAPLPRGCWPDRPEHAGHWVHFGYRDGLSGPRIQGWQEPPTGLPEGALPSRTHGAGEFLLGHPQDCGANPWQLSAADAHVRALYRNASFGVLRQIEQDVAAFQDFVGSAARTLARSCGLDAGHAPTSERLQAFIKAKLMGRWPAGHPLVPRATPQGAAPQGPLLDDAHLHYAADADGLGCPFGAHIRRMNPREGGEQLAHSARQRTLLRRGMPYGPWYEEGETPRHERGLMGLFFCASLEEQFEHITGHWGAGIALGSRDPGTAHDPFVATQPSAARLVIPLAGRPRPLVLQPPDCVRTRGSAYLLYPSRPALQHLAHSEVWKEVVWNEP
jgi:deferrochelatase/peroxidase EfeB